MGGKCWLLLHTKLGERGPPPSCACLLCLPSPTTHHPNYHHHHLPKTKNTIPYYTHANPRTCVMCPLVAWPFLP